MSLSFHPRTIPLAALAAALACSGCKAREIGVQFADQQSNKVDATWVTAVKTCWPALAHNGLSDESLKHELADPLHFRAAFAPYASYSDKELIVLVSHPVMDAPTPDTSLFKNSNTPIVSAEQASQGITPSINAPASTAAETALCSIHDGTPVGFR